MKITQEKADKIRVMLDMPKFLQRLDVEDLRALLDDRDELARLREGLEDTAAQWQRLVSAMQETIDRTNDKDEEHLGYRHALEDCAYEVQELLNNGDGDGDQ